MDQQNKVCAVCKKNQKFIFEYQKYFYYRCGSCGFVSTYPFPDSAAIDAHYAQKFKQGNYQLLRKYSQSYNRVYNDFIDVLDKALGLNGEKMTGLKVLDVGCFTGEFLCLMQERKDADVYGLELQADAVAIANQRLAGRVFKTDIFAENFPAKDFDIITLLGIVEHVVDPVGLLKRSSQFLKPGGLLLIQTPNSGSFLARLLGKWWLPYAPVEHIHLFTKKSFRLALGELGFKNLVFKPHWKKLPVAYVFNMLQNFGPEFYRLFKPIYERLPSGLNNSTLSFYVGETIVVAKKC